MDKVLIIDDDRFTQSLLHKSLYQHYEVRTADDGTTGMRLASSWNPNVILLDVEMPGKNGYEICDELKHQKETQDIPVLFLSSHSSIRQRILGFEVGGDDFLVKPCSQELLRKKLSKLSEFHQQKQSLKKSINTAEKTAMEALSTSFEIGKAVRFVERTYTTPNYDNLGEAITETMSDLKLSACVLLKSNHGNHYYSTSNAVAPLEKDILEKLHDKDRFMDFGCRTQVNYPQISLLVKNMPLDDRPRYGRIKDILPFLLGAADAKIKILDAETALREQNDLLINSITTLKKILAQTSDKMKLNKHELASIMSKLTSELSLELHKIGLENDQEEYVLKKVDNASDLLHKNLADSQPLEKTLTEIIILLNELAQAQKRVITENLSSEDNATDNNITTDIEIF